MMLYTSCGDGVFLVALCLSHSQNTCVPFADDVHLSNFVFGTHVFAYFLLNLFVESSYEQARDSVQGSNGTVWCLPSRA